MDRPSINSENSHEIMDEGTDLCSSSSSSDASVDSIASSPSDLDDDGTSPDSSSSPLDQPTSGPLYEMPTLMEQLPCK